MTTKRKIIIQTAVTLGLIIIGVTGLMLFKACRKGPAHQQSEYLLPLVRTVPVHIGTVKMAITGLGTVQATTESRLVPQISGQVVQVSDNLVNGGSFIKDEELLVIDPRDYEIAVILAEAGVKEAESHYATALQESAAAKAEWRRINPDIPVPPLVAREPQLMAARAGLDAQRANLEKARLNLARTRITAPFNGRVADEQVDVGQYVTPGQVLAGLYATDTAEIVVPLENNDLNWLAVPGFTSGLGTGSKATIRARVAGREMTWSGRVFRAEGAIDARTRLVNIIIRVPAPYATQPPLAVGQFVEVEIAGRPLEQAAVLPRAALRGESAVWVVDPDTGRLYFRPVEIARKDERGVIIRNGLQDSDLAVISPLKAVTDGMKVRFLDLPPTPDTQPTGESTS